MKNWLDYLLQLQRANTPAVMVTVAGIQGSTPREVGAKMIVTAEQLFGTIGGGNLEYQACNMARQQIDGGDARPLKRFPLGAGLGQCCGGVVELLFEPITAASSWVEQAQSLQSLDQDWLRVIKIGVRDAEQLASCFLLKTTDLEHDSSLPAALTEVARTMCGSDAVSNLQYCGEDAELAFFEVNRRVDFQLVLFGAGHVGRALTKTLSDFDIKVRWVDSRDDQFPAELAPSIEAICTDTPEAEIDAAPAGSFFLVMTHDHGLDQILCEQILRRGDFAYLGLIGSKTKRAKFESRLRRRGFAENQLQRMTCPIGVAGIRSKQPVAIAISVAAEIIRIYDQQQCLAEEGLLEIKMLGER